jgi:hypothetical protein
MVPLLYQKSYAVNVEALTKLLESPFAKLRVDVMPLDFT